MNLTFADVEGMKRILLWRGLNVHGIYVITWENICKGYMKLGGKVNDTISTVTGSLIHILHCNMRLTCKFTFLFSVSHFTGSTMFQVIHVKEEHVCKLKIFISHCRMFLI